MIKEQNLKKIEEIANLKDNWNNNGAKAFDKNYLFYIRKLINSISEIMQPEIFPVAYDPCLVQFEWETRGWHLELEIKHNEKSTLYFYSEYLNIENTIDIYIDIENLNSFLTLLFYTIEE